MILSFILTFLLSCGERATQRATRDDCKDQSATLNYFYGSCLEDLPAEECDDTLARALYQAHLCSGMKVTAPF